VQTVGRALVVEDDPALGRALQAFAARHAQVVHWAATKADAMQAIPAQDPDVVLLDIGLPDGSGADLLETLSRRPRFPRVIAVSGSADPDTAFRLAQAGVRSFVTKPLKIEDLRQAWEQALESIPDLRPLLRVCVGGQPLGDLEALVRGQMVDEALAIVGGSRTHASQLLGISRQHLQHILRARGGPTPGTPALTTTRSR